MEKGNDFDDDSEVKFRLILGKKNKKAMYVTYDIFT